MMYEFHDVWRTSVSWFWSGSHGMLNVYACMDAWSSRDDGASKKDVVGVEVQKWIISGFGYASFLLCG